jgi:NAD(P)-dependent dehydrogenase (short-subunit alcohol dehydrogenase family)
MSETRRVALVTGSTDGIGKETALGLARGGARVIVHGRSRPRVDAAIADLHTHAPDGQFEALSFDLGSMESVRRGAGQLRELTDRLDILVCNAGIFANERVVTADGIELSLAVNHVSHHLLHALARPLLDAAAVAGAPPRVIVVSSVAHTRGRIHLDDLTLSRGYTGYAAYAQSKLANVMFALSIAERFDETQRLAYSLHPGVIATKLLRQGFGPVPGATPEQGATTQLHLALSAEPLGPSGSYFSEGRPSLPAPAALDDDTRHALWTATERLAGLT